MRASSFGRFVSTVLTLVLVFTAVPFVASPAAYASLPPSNVNYQSVSFVDAQTGWIAGSGGTIIRTRNGGENWEVLNTGTTDTFVAVSFRDLNRGWALTSNLWVYRTQDGGDTWTRMQALRHRSVAISGDGTAVGYDLDMVDADTGFLTARAYPPGYGVSDVQGLVYRTTNGGSSWSLVLEGPDYRTAGAIYPFDGESVLRGVDFVSPTHGWVVGIDTGGTVPKSVVYRTTQGGGSGQWVLSNMGTLADELHAVSFITTSIGMVVGANGRIATSTNGGQSWTVKTSGTTQILRDVFMLDAQNAWAVGDAGTIRRTVNGGDAWTTGWVQSATVTLRSAQVLSAPSLKGWIAGDAGRVRITTDGQNWYPPNPDLTGPTITGLASSTHPSADTWYTSNGPVSFTWTEATDPAGVTGYSVSFSQDSGVVPNDTINLQPASNTSFTDAGPKADGVWYFKVKGRDGFGNWGPVATRTVRIDTQAPSGTIAVNDGAAYTNSRDVTVRSTVSWGPSGPGTMRLSADGGSTWGAWTAFTELAVATLPAGDGTKTVHAQFRDAAGNTSVSSAVDTIVLDTTVPSATLTINSGATYTNNRNVSVASTVTWGLSGANAMRFSVDGGSTWTAWAGYATPAAVTLPATEGSREVRGQFRDGAGNISLAALDTIVLDTTVPSGSILINGGAENTVSTTVIVTSNIDFGPSGPGTMRTSVNGGSTWTSWAPFATDVSVVLPAGNGTKTVHAQFTDGAGNVSASITDSIVLDTTAPEVTSLTSATHPDAATWYASRTVNLAWTVTSASGIEGYSYTWSANPAVEPDTVRDTTGTTYSVADVADGVWYFKVRAENGVGVWGPPVSRTVRIDGTAPVGTAVLSDGATYTATRDVTLASSVTWGLSGADSMQISVDGGSTWGAWEPYSALKVVTLPAGDGEKSVHVRFRDAAGNVAAAAAIDTIVLDATPPSASAFAINAGAAYTATRAVTVASTVTWGLSGADAMQFSTDGGTSWTEWTTYAASSAITLPVPDGTKEVRARFRDGAGNISQAAIDTIVLDTTAPSGTLVLDGGARYAAGTSVLAESAVAWGASGADAMRYKVDSGVWSAWEPYAASRQVTLSAGEGVKTVTAEFRDRAGNVGTIAATIEVLGPVIQVAGTDRYATAVAASKAAYPSGLDSAGTRTVVIATGRNWPDALGGTSLAGVLDGPVLLVNTTSVPAAVLTEITRLGAQKAIILGGETAVGPAVFTALRDALGTGNVTRIAGANRYETADAVAKRVISELGSAYDGTAFVSTGAQFADAVAAAPLAAANGWPLYLVNPSQPLSAATKSAMAGVDDVLLLGGTAAVPASLAAAIDAHVPGTVTRLAGDSRYATAVAIATYGVDHAGLGWNLVGIATGEDYPDALAGGVAQGKARSVMLLTRSTVLRDETSAALTAHRNEISTVTYYGGTGAVSTAVRAAVAEALLQ